MGLEVVKRMDAAELAAWRKGRDVDSAAGTTKSVGPTDAGHTWKRDYVKPLGAKDTHRAMFEQIFSNWTSDPETFQAAVRWMRRRQPGLGHVSDSDMREFLMKWLAKTTEENLRSRNVIGHQPLDGVY